MKKYDYLIVGAGLYGAVFAHEATKKGKQCLVIDRRDHNGGNVYCESKEGINIHKYGAHIFHTSDEEVWSYVNSMVEFNRFTNSPIANYKGELYNLPFNMNTFNKLWGVITPAEAKAKIQEQRAVLNGKSPENLEEQAISLVGTDIYEKLIKGYTEKQWGRRCEELPAFIIKRLPVRYTYDNNYFNDKYQGIPVGGYNKLIESLLEGSDVRLATDFFCNREELVEEADKVVFTGMIDEFYDYKFGVLEYRSLRFETELIEEENYQGNAVVNYTDTETTYTRIIEHKHFEFGTGENTFITKEYPKEWEKGDEPYYPVLDDKNIRNYEKYRELADKEANIIFGGRLGEYKYYDMHNVIKAALDKVKEEFM
ncbi:MAG: UDP-galactopyranose mutase [Clostridium sp.]|uniref:UDP-galactopyranose mutase n=1 Tax=Clostridium sp. TaxID=1506 RepID=UPI00321645A9